MTHSQVTLSAPTWRKMVTRRAVLRYGESRRRFGWPDHRAHNDQPRASSAADFPLGPGWAGGGLPVPGWAAGPPRVAMCFALAWPFALPLAFALAWRFTLAWPLRLAGPVALPWLSTLPGSAGREVAWGFCLPGCGFGRLAGRAGSVWSM